MARTLLLAALLALALSGAARADQLEDRAQWERGTAELVRLYRSGKFALAARKGEELVRLARSAFGPDHAKYATSLNNLAALYHAMGEYARAEPLFKEAIAIGLKALGKDHPSYATSLNNLAEFYSSMGEYARAEPLYKEAMEIERKVLGKDHPSYATSLNNLAGLYYSMGDYARAESLYKEAVEILGKALGKDRPNYATSLNNLARLYCAMGEYARAEPLFKEAVAIRLKALGEDHPHYATSLNNLAGLYHAMGEYARAEPLYKEAMAIDAKALGKDHPSYATSLNNVAELYRAMGEYARAEPLYKEAMAIDAKALGKDHPSYATSLSNLAALYYAMGEYARAEPLYKEAMAIDAKALGRDHPDYATDLNKLAVLYGAMGEYARAEPLYKEAMGIRLEALGKDHPSYATSLNNLAALYYAMGEYARAEPLYKEAMEIERKALGENHPDYAGSLNNLAGLYRAMGEYARAEPLYKEAMEIRLKALGRYHPDYGGSVNNLAGLYESMGEYARAESLYKEAVEILGKALGKDRPSYATGLNNLAVLYAAWGRPDAALDRFNGGLEAFQAHTVRTLAGLSPDRQLAFLETVLPHLEAFLALVRQNPGEPRFVSAGALWLARWKALSAEVLTQRARLLAAAPDPGTRSLVSELQSARAAYAQLVLSPPGGLKPEEIARRRAEAEGRVEALEDALAKKSAGFAQIRRIGRADLADVARALPPGAVLLDFARFRTFDFAAKGTENRWGEARYVVFITAAGNPAARMADLGPAQPIDDAVANFRKAIAGGERKKARLSAADEAETRKALSALSRLVIGPVVAHVQGKKHWIICPAGDLAFVPFECLPMKGQKYLVEHVQISYLGAGREAVAHGGTDTAGVTRAPLLLGDPDFDLLPETSAEIAGPDTGQEPALRRGLRASHELGAVRFARLPGTRAEIQHAGKLIGGRALLDRRATEAELKRADAPRVLYLATHGFFLPDQEIPRDERGLGRGIAGLAAAGLPQAGSRMENPLVRCGLALAGANQRATVDPESARDDGVLTGMEAAGLRLWGTQLVVLSACETAVGQVKSGEGVMGLRRVFLLAGARRVMATLWKVPDEETQRLMSDFMERWHAGTPAVRALREAQMAMIKKMRNDRGHAHPYLWAAFTMTGDWR